ncbi:hypothetical protein BC936DRAFT_141172 [Jimgerdemannia flammicorona]|uniref:Uncharacterized protein n=2 Tax=Jimgerdemannia flammicorona TaxID=994334 RepID=A0A433DGA2_9FUNG|nr:hypothetical protein BC936DRAFT_141172 [Jimgerdemannia flammicorona]RUS34733.1 hypothetical protein BC938DRAFT_478854 [Jimgerdemannia flammicorona]
MKVLAADNDGALHFGGDDDASENATTDRHVTSEGALLVNVVALNGLFGGLKAKTDIFVPAQVLLVNLGVLEDADLFLEGFLDLRWAL